ncbi:hypothetical protein D4740_06400 [Actinomyces sp. 2119]|nr:hypothetical protein D4740_06400 [Actinomyces sp. 2119]
MFNELSATRVVIAHRLSTVIDADIIFVIENGRVVERGSHRELIEKGGAYSELYLRSSSKESMSDGARPDDGTGSEPSTARPGGWPSGPPGGRA